MTGTAGTEGPGAAPPRGRALLTMAGLAAFLQLGCTLMTITVVFTLGPQPSTAGEFYALGQEDRPAAILRLDFFSLANVALFAVTAFALYSVLKESRDPLAGFAMASMFLGVAIALAAHPGLSMIHLGERFQEAGDDVVRSRLLAAGDAVLAGGWSASTAGLTAGIFLQGGMVLMSFLMLQSGIFGKLACVTGMLSNGLDFLHIFVDLVHPGAAAVLLSAGGLLYLIWFPALGLELLRLGRTAAPR